MGTQTDKFRISNVIGLYPMIHKRSTFDVKEGQEGKFEITLLIPKVGREELLKTINSYIQQIVKADRLTKLVPSDLCLRDGATAKTTVIREQFSDHWYLKMSSNFKVFAYGYNPADGELTPEQIEHGLYSGCMVNVVTSLWGQNHTKFGQRVNANFISIQKNGEGEKIGGGFEDTSGMFDVIPVPEGMGNVGKMGEDLPMSSGTSPDMDLFFSE